MKKLTKSILTAGLAASVVMGGLAPYSSAYAMEKLGMEKQLNQTIKNKLGLKTKSIQSIESRKNKEEEVFSENTLIVKYKKPLAASVHSKAGTKLVKRISSLGYDVVELAGQKKLEDAVAVYSQMAEVSSISRSALVKRFGSPDPKANDMYHLDLLDIDKVSGMGGKNKVKVAVVDTGIDPNHPELKNKIVYNYNVANPLQKGLPDVHGTHVAGIIGAEKDNGIGGYGVNPNVDIYSIDVFGRSFFTGDYAIAEGILKAVDQKVQVINLSLGSSFPSPIIEEAVKKAIDAGIVVVAAAGNSATNARHYPAAFDGVISVGSTNDKNNLSDYSNYGPSVDIVAPGEEVYNSIYDYEKKSSFGKLSGTSMSSPMVAGAVSLLLSKYPNLTPYQVNYILTKSASDLGDKGYDLKYGHGLLNIADALMANPKNIPANPQIAEKDLLAKAEKVNVSSSLSKEGTLTHLGQTDWIQFDVKAGEAIQTLLSGSENYDYQYDLLFFPDGANKPSSRTTVNDVAENRQEGNMFEAPGNGKVVIGIKDANGNYSEEKKSKYSLKIDKHEKKNDDNNTKDKPVILDSIPFKTENKYYFTNDPAPGKQKGQLLPGDSDYFHFKIPVTDQVQDTAVKVSIPGVPGIDSTVKIYMVPPVMEEKSEAAESKPTEEKPVQEEPLFGANNAGIGQGETLTFGVQPGMEYKIEVTNRPGYWGDFYYFEQPEIDLTRSYSSNIPYSVNVELASLPKDEDNFPNMKPEEGEKGENPAVQEDKPATEADVPESEWVTQIKKIAMPVKLDEEKSGYFQYMHDQDWYAFTPEKDAIYDFSFLTKDGEKAPYMDIFTYNKEWGDFMMISSNITWGENGIQSSEHSYAGLKGGETYYISLNELKYGASFDPYKMKITAAVENIMDKHEDNDDYDKAKPVSFEPVNGNFAAVNDLDFYYFNPEETGLYGFTMKQGEVPSNLSGLPKELKAPLDSAVVVIEDSNGNKKLDPGEEGKYTMFDAGYDGETERGSVFAKRLKGYFVAVFNYWGNSSVVPYSLKFTKTNQADEDKGSAVKNNVPSKPIVLKADKKGKLQAEGYLNPTNNKADSDYYKLTVGKALENKLLKIKTFTDIDLDTVITLYDAKGKQLAKSDAYGNNSYGRGDSEILLAKLKKGDYYIKIEDANGSASISPYKLTVEK